MVLDLIWRMPFYLDRRVSWMNHPPRVRSRQGLEFQQKRSYEPQVTPHRSLLNSYLFQTHQRASAPAQRWIFSQALIQRARWPRDRIGRAARAAEMSRAHS